MQKAMCDEYIQVFNYCTFAEKRDRLVRCSLSRLSYVYPRFFVVFKGQFFHFVSCSAALREIDIKLLIAMRTKFTLREFCFNIY